MSRFRSLPGTGEDAWSLQSARMFLQSTGVSVVALAVLVFGGLPVAAEGNTVPEVSASTWKVYGAAIRDAAVSRPGEVVTDLLVPTPEDPRTTWADFEGEQFMLVQTVSYRPVAEVLPGESFSTSSDVWIAVPGEMDEICRDYGCSQMNVKELDLAFKQVIGLPPDADYSVLALPTPNAALPGRPSRPPQERGTDQHERQPEDRATRMQPRAISAAAIPPISQLEPGVRVQRRT